MSGEFVTIEGFKELPNSINSWKEFLSIRQVVTPIDESQIPEFKDWICWNGYRPGDGCHPSFDFALYRSLIDKVLWVPQLEIRAIANGIVERINTERSSYWVGIELNHVGSDGWLGSYYAHIIPEVEEGNFVERGQKLGNLFVGEGRLTHLDFGLLEPVNYFDSGKVEFNWDRYLHDNKASMHINPSVAFPFLEKLNMVYPQQSETFTKIVRRVG